MATSESHKSIWQIIIYGYQQGLTHIRPLSIAFWPIWVLYFICSSFLEYRFSESSFGIVAPLCCLFLSILWLYTFFVLSRYIRDCYWEGSSKQFIHYFKPNQTFLGFSGTVLLTIVYGALAGILGVIGLVFLVVPGLVIFSYYTVWSGLLSTAFLIHPGFGVISAYRTVLRLLKGDFWRAMVIGFVFWVAMFVVNIPMMIFMLISPWFMTLMPKIEFSILYGTVDTVTTIVNYCFMQTCLLFALNHYYQELDTRQHSSF